MTPPAKLPQPMCEMDVYQLRKLDDEFTRSKHSYVHLFRGATQDPDSTSNCWRQPPHPTESPHIQSSHRHTRITNSSHQNPLRLANSLHHLPSMKEPVHVDSLPTLSSISSYASSTFATSTEPSLCPSTDSTTSTTDESIQAESTNSAWSLGVCNANSLDERVAYGPSSHDTDSLDINRDTISTTS